MNDPTMPHAADQAPIIAFLGQGAAYGEPGMPVERLETHGALVFLAGERAYKLKRSVRYSYLDYSTPDKRREMIEAELAVNRPLAPGIYLGLQPVLALPSGGFALGALVTQPEARHPSGHALDWLLVMRRFGQEQIFENIRRHGGLSAELMQKLGDKLAHIHALAPLRPDFGGAAGIAAVIDENAVELAKAPEAVASAAERKRLSEATWRLFTRRRSHLEWRREAGKVRRVHGDLHLNNIVLLEGEPVLFDAIEFEESFAAIDVFFDLALLLADLDRHGERVMANALLNRYLEASLDFDGLSVLPLFLSCRAAIRAHVSAAQATLAADEKRSALLKEAHGFFRLALAYVDPPPPRLVVIGGASGTGKSSVARALAPSLGAAPGAVVLRSDVIRKRLHGVPETQPLPALRYTPAATQKVYATMLDHAADILAGGHGVILDAVFGEAEQIDAVRRLARDTRLPLAAYWLEAPAGQLEQRINARRNDASDADAGVLQNQLAHLDPPEGWQRIDASRALLDVAADIARRLGIVLL